VEANACEREISIDPPEVHDNCEIDTLFNSQAEENHFVATFPLDTIEITWIAIDISGNTTIMITKVIVRDTAPPVSLCKSIVLALDSTGMATLEATDIDS